MTTTTRTKLQDIALAGVAVFCVIVAIWFAKNGFTAAAFAGTATICVMVLTAVTLTRKSPEIWGARISKGKGVIVIYSLVSVVVSLYDLGLFF